MPSDSKRVSRPARTAQAMKSAQPAKATRSGRADGGARKDARSAARPGGERARDEARSGGPRYGGEDWSVADERGDRRFGHARNDDADPSELAPGQAGGDDDDWPSAVDPELAEAEARGEIESGGRRAGMGRGEHPRKPASRAKK